MMTIFDLDETLIQGDCSTLWGQWLCAKGYVTDIADFTAQNNLLVEDYHNQRLDQQACMDLLFAPIKHLSTSEIAPLVQDFVTEQIMPIIYHEGLEKLTQYQAQGIETIIISASPHLLVQIIAEQCFKVPTAFGINIEEQEGFYTGKIIGTIPYQAGKVTVYEQYIRHKLKKMGAESHRAAIDTVLEDTSFYSDSINDLPLLSKVRYPRTVNPDSALRQIAHQHDWPIYHFTKTA